MGCIMTCVTVLGVLIMLRFIFKNVVQYQIKHLDGKNSSDPHDIRSDNDNSDNDNSDNDNSDNYIVCVNVACLIMGLLSALLLLIYIVKKRHIHQWRPLIILGIIVNVCVCITAVVFLISNFFYPLALDTFPYVFWIVIGIQPLNLYQIYVLYKENKECSVQNIVAAKGVFTTTAIPA